MGSGAAASDSSELQRLWPAAVHHEDLAVADAAGAGDTHDPVGHLLGPLVADPDADLDLGQVRQAVLAAGVTVEVALLAAVALGLLYDTGRDVQLGDGPQHRLGPERLDDDGELFHSCCPLGK